MDSLSWDALSATLADPAATDALAWGAVVVDVSGLAAVGSLEAAALRRLPAITVATGVDAGSPVAGAFDVAGDEAIVDDVLAACERQPAAAATLVQVLRQSTTLDIAGALAVESLAYSMLLAGPAFASWLEARGAARTPRVEAEPPVVLGRDGDTLLVSLNRPRVHNAFSASMRDALVEALQVPLLDTSIEQVVLRGEGPSFCSGGDLDEFGTAADPVAAHLIRTRRSAGAAVAAVSGRTTIITHGTCVGAGVELAAFAGHVVARPGASFRLPEIAMGLIPGAGGTVSLPRRIGRQRTALLALSGAAIDAATAARWGLVDEIID